MCCPRICFRETDGVTWNKQLDALDLGKVGPAKLRSQVVLQRVWFVPWAVYVVNWVKHAFLENFASVIDIETNDLLEIDRDRLRQTTSDDSSSGGASDDMEGVLHTA
jgi:hypothetical protein